ncbi:DUF4386 family protein [Deinococcus planocerae]|uniref:DUF4386 family protein n=1 Tax=Deinococcus planocerae TaxID=1737569 RepID=UPI0015E0897E|nr:DUF4386 family protein [Deinococcus planocerae]
MSTLQDHQDQALTRLGGCGALLAGALFLLSLVYVYGALAQAGLDVEMFDDQGRLLPWVAEHARAYTGLWWLTLLSSLALLPAPLALHDRLRPGARGVSRVAAVAGLGGVVFGLAAPLVLAAASPVLAQGYVQASGGTRDAVEVVGRMVGDLALHLRLGSDLLLGVWLALSGGLLLRLRRSAALGTWFLVTAVLAGVVIATKPLGLADLEPFLAPVLSLAYLGLGTALLRGVGTSRAAVGPTHPPA